MTRTRVTDIFRDCQLYLQSRIYNSQATKAFRDNGNKVRDYLLKHGTEDDEGNLVYEFPGALTASDGKDYSGVMLRKNKPSAYFDVEEVERFARHKRLSQGDVITWTPAVNEDGLYGLYQDGQITEEELRGLIHYREPVYSLWPITHTEELEE